MTQEVYHSTSITYMGTKDLKTAGPCWNRILQISEAFCLSLTCCHRWKVCKDDMRVCRVARSYYWSQRVHHATFLNIVVNVVRQSFAWHMAQWLYTFLCNTHLRLLTSTSLLDSRGLWTRASKSTGWGPTRSYPLVWHQMRSSSIWRSSGP